MRKSNETSLNYSRSRKSHPSKKDCFIDLQNNEAWPQLKSTSLAPIISEKMNSTEQTLEEKKDEQVCKSCHKKFIRIRSHKCKVFSNNEMNSSLEKCLGCQKQFKRISRHLSSSINCQKHYNLDELKKNQKATELLKQKERDLKRRNDRTEEEKATELMKQKERDLKRRNDRSKE